jgi:hypothetical protein
MGLTVVSRPPERHLSRAYAALPWSPTLVQSLKSSLLPLGGTCLCASALAGRGYCSRQSPNNVVLSFHNCHNSAFRNSLHTIPFSLRATTGSNRQALSSYVIHTSHPWETPDASGLAGGALCEFLMFWFEFLMF